MGVPTRQSWTLAVVAVLLLSLVLVGVALAQGSSPTDDEVNAIAKELYCPVCENVPLDVCPTQACAQWRELIREKLADGWGEAQIKDYFVVQYGDRVLAEPPRRGLNWLVYVLPPLAILAGAYILVRALRGWRAAVPEAAAGPPDAAAAEDDYIRRLEQELERRS